MTDKPNSGTVSVSRELLSDLQTFLEEAYDGGIEGLIQEECGNQLVELRAILAQPAEQQDAPGAKVGRLFPNGYSLVKQGEQSVSVVWHGISMTFSEREPDARMGQLIDFLRLMIDTTATQAVKLPGVDQLSNIIRQVDDNHSLSAGALAEKILDELAKLNGIEP